MDQRNKWYAKSYLICVILNHYHNLHLLIFIVLIFTLFVIIDIGIVEIPESVLSNNYGKMAFGETRTFQIDKKKYLKCRLAENEIEILKDDYFGQDNPGFIVVKNVASADVECRPGSINDIRVSEEARECGIGTMLMQLCLNEEKIHNVAENDKNQGLNLIRELSETNAVPNVKEVESWVDSNCEKLVSLDMTCSIPPSAHVFFSSALASGYTEMFFALIMRSRRSEFYPSKIPGLVKDMKERYNDNGYIVESDGNEIKVAGEMWYFCQPRNAK